MVSTKVGVWVFSGEGAVVPSGVFSEREKAIAWIEKHRLSGVLSWYPIDEGLYDWTIENDIFQPKNDFHHTADFIQTFASASLDHDHFEDGECD